LRSHGCSTALVQWVAGCKPYPARGRMKQGQDLGCATADVFVRLDGGLAVRLPRHTGMRHGLEGASFVLAPDRQPKLRAERIGVLDQPLFTAASGSTRVTVPRFRRRVTTPV
jgi:hypothetical protein